MASTLYEYYQGQGQALPGVGERANVYQQYGLGSAGEYQGTAEQNTRLLGALKGGSASPQSPVSASPPVTASQPQANQPQTSYRPGSNSGQPQTAQDLVNMGYYGYQGWDDASAIANFRDTGGSGKGSQTGSYSAQPSIDLTSLYESAYKDAGIADVETKITEVQNKINDARTELAKATAKINENPFLSEANRVGRIRKLEELANDTINNFLLEQATYQDDLAKKKADIETKLNLQLKQYDIHSQQTQMALNQFNTLLSIGALNNASSQDIADITRTTGLSSSVIQSAIQSNKQQGIQTNIQSFDDGTNEGFMVVSIDQQGNIVNTQTQITGNSSQGSGGGGSVAEREQGRLEQLLVQDVKSGLVIRDAITLYKDVMNLNDILRLYNQYSIYGPAKESINIIRGWYEGTEEEGQKTGSVGSFSSSYGF